MSDMMEDGFVMGSKASGVPAGPYLAEFVGYEPLETQKGPAWKWSWKITAGPLAGQHATCLTDRADSQGRPMVPRPSNKFGKLLNGLAGKTIGEAERFNPKTCVGKPYTIIVEAGPNGGGTRVVTVAPPMV